MVLCEDDRDARRWILAQLERAGCDVVGLAETGASALRLADGTQPDLVVIDLALLGTPGFRYAELLRVLAPRTALILISPLGQLEAGPPASGIHGFVGAHDVDAFRRALAAVRCEEAATVPTLPQTSSTGGPPPPTASPPASA